MATLALEGISRNYGAARVVDSLDLSLNSGEFVTLLGPSGCGKSTTLKVIAGLERPDAGRVRLDGRDVTTLPASRRDIGMVFQSLALFPHMTVSQNVAFGLRMRGLPGADVRRRVGEALELVRMTAFAGRVPAQLSGGQQQRVALARAFVISPAVMLLDEPLSALDRSLREAMQIEIRALTRRLGVTAIFVTHDQAEALVLSDRVAVMNRGRIVQIDTPDKLFRQPSSEFVAAFMGVSNRFDALCADGRIVAPCLPGLILSAPHGCPSGAVRLGLRPEDARVRPIGQAPAEGWVAAAVETAIFAGTTMALTLRLQLAPATTLEVVVPAGEVLFRAGDIMEVTWPCERVLLLTTD